MSWGHAAVITRRWATMSDHAARDRGVDQDRLREARAFMAEFPDQDALYVERNALVGRVLHRLAQMFEGRDQLTGDEFSHRLTEAYIDATEVMLCPEPTR